MLSLMKKSLKSFVEDESGQDLIEYCLLGGIVLGAVATAVTGVATAISTRLGALATAI